MNYSKNLSLYVTFRKPILKFCNDVDLRVCHLTTAAINIMKCSRFNVMKDNIYN